MAALPDNEALFAMARAWVQRHYPGRIAARICLYLDDGSKASLPVPLLLVGDDPDFDADEPPADAVPTPPAELRSAILATLRQSPQPLKASAIARRCGRSYTSHFRTVLRTLTDAGEVERLPDRTYRLPQE